MYNINTMLKQNGGPVTIQSVLLSLDLLGQSGVDGSRNAAIAGAVTKANQLWGGQNLTVRDLNPLDMSYANNVFTDTSNATINQWNAMATGAFTVPTATVIAIYGIKIGWLVGAAAPPINVTMPVTAIRIDVGGSRHVQWHLQSLDQKAPANTTSPYVAIAGVTRSPIVVAEDITVTLFEYTRIASNAYDPVWLGVAVEKEGVTLKP